MLRGTIRDHVTQQRRPLLGFFACEQDLSDEVPDVLLPDAVVLEAEPVVVVRGIAGEAVLIPPRPAAGRMPGQAAGH
jgi:sulfur-carrier protein